MNYLLEPFKRYADFSGRATRKEYWMFTLFFFVIAIALVSIGQKDNPVLLGVFYLGSFIPYMALTTRRLHDIGRSGWWQLIGLVPLIGWIVMLVFLVMDSVDENKHGPNPKMLAVVAS